MTVIRLCTYKAAGQRLRQWVAWEMGAGRQLMVLDDRSRQALAVVVPGRCNLKAGGLTSVVPHCPDGYSQCSAGLAEGSPPADPHLYHCLG